jgi:hypothetical protein
MLIKLGRGFELELGLVGIYLRLGTRELYYSRLYRELSISGCGRWDC